MEDNKHVNPATNPANEGRTSERSEERSAGNGAPGARTSADILREMDSLARRMGIYSEGVYYLIENGAPEEVCDAFTERTDRSAATFIADKLKLEGEERERFMNRETRTAEERELIQSMLLRASAHRLERYFKSKYLEAIGTIAESVETALELKLEELDQKDYDSLATAINMLNRFYFVQVNKEIDPLSGEPLSEAEVEELRKLSRDYVAFHQAQSKPPAESVIDFISPAMGDIIELSAQSDMTFLPLSLIYRDQRSIAARGSEGALENVGKNTDAGEVLVEAHISDKDGNPLTIDAVMQGVQSAIGQLIDENGRVLPIIVTPQQVYRAYARLPNDAKVTMQQAAEMERAMDALMFSPSRLDFTAQLEKHKKIKHQADYNYTDKNAGRLTGNLITAEKGEGTNRLGERQVAYKIFSYPSVFSHCRTDCAGSEQAPHGRRQRRDQRQENSRGSAQRAQHRHEENRIDPDNTMEITTQAAQADQLRSQNPGDSGRLQHHPHGQGGADSPEKHPAISRRTPVSKGNQAIPGAKGRAASCRVLRLLLRASSPKK